MNNLPLVSIVLPAFNAERTVGDAIASLLLQTYQNWELLVIDDGSGDATVAIASRFCDCRIRIFCDGINKGLPARLNEGVERSSGKYFARMDHDDLCFPDRIKKQVEYLEAHPDVDLLATRAMTFVTPGTAIGLFPFRETHADISRRPWNGFYLPHPTWLGRTAWFRAHRYRTPEVKRAEDQELLLRALPTSRYACLPEVLLAYRVRARPSLKLNLTARASLLASQLRIFGARSQWGSALLAVLACGAKTAKDLSHWLARSRGWRTDPGAAVLMPQWEELKVKIAQMQAAKSCQAAVPHAAFTRSPP